jgi:hypothetical protein
MENGTRRRTRGINNRPGTNRPGSLVLPAPQPPQPTPVFDQTNQQNMLEHMDTTTLDSGGATGTIPGFPEVPADLESFTFDTSSFPDFPEYLNSGPPTSPATAATFIDDYLNAPTSPQGLLGFEGGTRCTRNSGTSGCCTSHGTQSCTAGRACSSGGCSGNWYDNWYNTQT